VTDPILSAHHWPSNAHLIADVAKLGYLDGRVCDLTYGLGTFWKIWTPNGSTFVASDIDVEKSPCRVSIDFRHTPFNDGEFDVVVLDPPYRYNGKPDPTFDERYGTHVYTRWQDRRQLIYEGTTEAARITRRYVCLKCMDQVVSGRKRWQTIDFMNHAATVGLELVDRFDMLVTPRPQPTGRQQVHSQGNYSSLLIFEKGK
jgi:hypothetical protein